MNGVMVPTFTICITAVRNTSFIAIMTLVVIRLTVMVMHYNMAIAPMKTTEKEVETNVYTGMPVKWAMMVVYNMMVRVMPVHRRVVRPMPSPVNYASVVVWYVYHFFFRRLNDDSFFFFDDLYEVSISPALVIFYRLVTILTKLNTD